MAGANNIETETGACGQGKDESDQVKGVEAIITESPPVQQIHDAEEGGADPLTSVVDVHENSEMEPARLSFFARYLSLWIFLGMLIGTTIGALVPAIPDALAKATIKEIWLPGAILVWFMIYPMMLGVKWSAIRKIHENPAGLALTTFVNWAVQPFLMYALALLFFQVIYDLPLDVQKDFIAGAVILGGSPCTAMVFVWSKLCGGDPNYTLVQVVLNDIILLFLYVPTTKLLLNISDIELPWGTVFLSVVLFVCVPVILGVLTNYMIQLRCPDKAGAEAFSTRIQNTFSPISSISLVVLVIFIFISQADVIVKNPVYVLMVMVPLILQTIIIFVLTYGLGYYICLKHNIAGPAAFIGSSNFFELAVALAITVYGPESGAVLVTVVGVLVEVPIMLLEVYIVNATKTRYNQRLVDDKCWCKN